MRTTRSQPAPPRLRGCARPRRRPGDACRFLLLGEAAGTYLLSGLLAGLPSCPAVTAGGLLSVLGAFTTSAQILFHYWLAGAMQAPTPVSAYLHAAAMVKAGVYLVTRLTPALVAVTAVWRPLVVGVGIATMLLGAARALRQHDLKLLLATGRSASSVS
jgi:multicomponent Na+:H+ antiporter subunit A